MRVGLSIRAQLLLVLTVFAALPWLGYEYVRELERVLREKSVLEERVSALTEQLRVFRERETAMNEALVAAQQLREATHTAAEREAQVIVREAEAEGRQRVDAAEREEEDARQRMAEVQRQFAAYLAGFRALLERQLAELRTLEGGSDRG